MKPGKRRQNEAAMLAMTVVIPVRVRHVAALLAMTLAYENPANPHPLALLE